MCSSDLFEVKDWAEMCAVKLLDTGRSLAQTLRPTYLVFAIAILGGIRAMSAGVSRGHAIMIPAASASAPEENIHMPRY